MEHSCYAGNYNLPDGVSFNYRLWRNRMERYLHFTDAINDYLLRHFNNRYLSYSTKNGISIRIANKRHENIG